METDTLQDQVLVCRYCGQQFTWSVGEQKFYADRYLFPPRTCPEHRTSTRRRRYLERLEGDGNDG